MLMTKCKMAVGSLALIAIFADPSLGDNTKNNMQSIRHFSIDRTEVTVGRHRNWYVEYGGDDRKPDLRSRATAHCKQPAGFTSRHDHWGYLAARDEVPNADRILARLCDVRLPLALDDDDCEAIAAVLGAAMRQALA